jgi:hypothetical protein
MHRNERFAVHRNERFEVHRIERFAVHRNERFQLNVERGQLRRKPMRFRNIEEPFNNLRWNFTKIKQAEVMRMSTPGVE